MKRIVIKFAALGALLITVSFAVIVINQSAQLVELAARLHPLAGQALLWALVAFYAACLIVPLVLWLRLPRSMVPPARDAGAEFERYLAGLRARLKRNPRLAGVTLSGRSDVESALRQLDGAADEIIKKAAARVFLATAVSQNGSLDTLVVLGLQTRLVWEVAHVYRQRPSLRDLGWLYANVLTTAFIAGEIEDLDLSEQIQPVVQNALGSAAGAVPGLQVAGALVANAVMTGTANAFLTLRVGVVARRYCGSLTRPQKKGLRRSAFAEAAAMLGAIAASGTKKVMGALAKASGRTAVRTVTGVGSAVRSGAGSAGSAVVSGAGSVGGAVKKGVGAVVDTLTFRRKGEDD